MACLDQSTRAPHRVNYQVTFATALAIAASCFAACGPAEGGGSTLPYGNNPNGGSSSGAAGSAGSGFAGSGVGGSGVGGVGGAGINLDSGRADTGSDGPNCGAHTIEAKKVTKEVQTTKEVRARADVFIMFDQSASMRDPEGNTTRWQAVTQATVGFIQSPDSNDLGVGIGFFGRAAGIEECNTAVYAQPEVPIAVLPGNAGAIVNAINRHMPVSETPTTAALTGAIQHARDWKTRNPMIPVFVLLVTDGEPGVAGSFWNPISNCVGTAQDVPATVAAAQAGATGNPPIKTFVLGVGPSLNNLNQIASAGGTDRAYLFSGNNVAQEVVNALNTIRGKISTTETKVVTEVVPLECEWVMPAATGDQQQDPRKVNVRLTSPAGERPLGIVPSQAECANFQNGWYYDNPANPTKLVACPSTCDMIKGAGDARIDILVGCDTIIAPPL
jgi:Mg-chelatase subunit ChlD